MSISTVSKIVLSPVTALLLGLSYLGLILFLGTSSPFLVVRGVSMLPTFENGDLLINKRVPPTQIKVDDVIAFEVPSEGWEHAYAAHY